MKDQDAPSPIQSCILVVSSYFSLVFLGPSHPGTNLSWTCTEPPRIPIDCVHLANAKELCIFRIESLDLERRAEPPSFPDTLGLSRTFVPVDLALMAFHGLNSLVFMSFPSVLFRH